MPGRALKLQPRTPLDVALATAEGLPELDEDSRPLLEALRARGLSAAPVVWTRPVRWDRVALCLVRSTWDYDANVERFRAWAKAVHAETELLPSAALLAWNTDKAYLRALAAAEVPVVPTLWLEAARETKGLVPRLAERGWEDVIAKPAVAGDARGLLRFAAREAGEARVRAHLGRLLAAGPVLVQPFLGAVQAGGERSLLFADGRLTHAVVKRPASGDFRVQPQWGGTATLVEPTLAELAVAERALAAAPDPPAIARVDLLEHPELGPVVIELELVEPRLFLRARPEAADAFADAVVARLGTG